MQTRCKPGVSPRVRPARAFARRSASWSCSRNYRVARWAPRIPDLPPLSLEELIGLLAVLLLIASGIAWALLRERKRMDYATAPISDLSTKLTELIEGRPGRTDHYLPDLALKMLATQVLQYAHAFEHLAAGRLVSWSFPVARAAFEASEDLAYLAFAPDEAQYDRRGALAHVGAEISISQSYRLAQQAKPGAGGRKPLPEKERVAALVAEWERFRPGIEELVQTAYSDARRARAGGNKSWTLLSRSDTHEALQKELRDKELAKVLISWYDLLSDRTHPGLHSPQFDRHGTGHQFLIDGDEEHQLPEASIRFALILAIYSLRQQYALWDADPRAS